MLIWPMHSQWSCTIFTTACESCPASKLPDLFQAAFVQLEAVTLQLPSPALPYFAVILADTTCAMLLAQLL